MIDIHQTVFFKIQIEDKFSEDNGFCFTFASYSSYYSQPVLTTTF